MTTARPFSIKRNPQSGPLRKMAERPVTVPAAACDPIDDALDQAEAMPKLLLPKTVAEMLSVTERTLERWRITGDGPRFVKLTRGTVRYAPADIAAFVAERMRAHTADTAK